MVDDEPPVCNMLKKFLTKNGYRVITALNGEEALKKVRRNRPHIVLLDIKIPGMDGIEILKRIKDFDKKNRICVIMISVLMDNELAKKCLELGAFDYISKPLSLEYLENALTMKSLGFK